ncbi:hypothetical protein JW805_15580 [Roseomonas aeriglobus]|nr:hypothetical protein [Roseomonas aeriglobus]
MDPETSARHRSGGLETAAARLARRLQASVTAREARQAHLDDLIRDAETWLHRRAAWNDRDKALYRTGAALEPYGGHRLDDIKLGGLDALGSQGVLLLAQTALQYPDQPLSQLIAILFESSHGPSIAEWGRWSRLHWLAALHAEETAAFLETGAGRDPKAAWRRRTPTRRQVFLADEMARALGIDLPAFATRGEAFDWIHRGGGNPRYWALPALPEVPS